MRLKSCLNALALLPALAHPIRPGPKLTVEVIVRIDRADNAVQRDGLQASRTLRTSAEHGEDIVETQQTIRVRPCPA